MNNPVLFIINNTIRLINTSAPPSAKISFQRLRLANPIERTSLNIADDGIEPFQCLSILRLPVLYENVRCQFVLMQFTPPPVPQETGHGCRGSS